MPAVPATNSEDAQNRSTTTQTDTPIALRCRSRVVRRLMPFLFVLYVIAYLDRVNVGFAALGMKGDFKFTDQIIGLGAGIFFIGYVLLEIPGTILVEKWTAKGWIARIMISWGILAMLTGFRSYQESVLHNSFSAWCALRQVSFPELSFT